MRRHSPRLALRRRPTALTLVFILAYAVALAVLAADVLIWRP